MTESPKISRIQTQFFVFATSVAGLLAPAASHGREESNWTQRRPPGIAWQRYVPEPREIETNGELLYELTAGNTIFRIHFFKMDRLTASLAAFVSDQPQFVVGSLRFSVTPLSNPDLRDQDLAARWSEVFSRNFNRHSTSNFLMSVVGHLGEHLRDTRFLAQLRAEIDSSAILFPRESALALLGGCEVALYSGRVGTTHQLVSLPVTNREQVLSAIQGKLERSRELTLHPRFRR